MKSLFLFLLATVAWAQTQTGGGPSGGGISGPYVQSVNGNTGAVTLNTLTGTYTWANLQLQTCGASQLNYEEQATDLGSGGSWWACTFDAFDNAYEWVPKNGVFSYLINTTCYILPSSGSIANNGALTLTTALDQTYSQGCYMYFPAGAIAAGSAAGFYWTVMSSTTLGTIFNNPLYLTVATLPSAASSSGKTFWIHDGTSATDCTTGASSSLVACTSNGTVWSVAVQSPYNLAPASNTAFATTGPGAYTQTTGAYVQAMPFEIQGNVQGKRGQLEFYTQYTCSGTTNSKTVGTAWGLLTTGSGPWASSANTTAADVAMETWYRIRNLGALNSQWQNFNALAVANANGAYQTVNTANLSVAIQEMQLATATDWIALRWNIIKVTRP